MLINYWHFQGSEKDKRKAAADKEDKAKKVKQVYHFQLTHKPSSSGSFCLVDID